MHLEEDYGRVFHSYSLPLWEQGQALSERKRLAFDRGIDWIAAIDCSRKKPLE